MATDDVINFYRTGDPFGEFSNFAAYPIKLKGVEWPTTEHYFQAQKFVGTPHEEEVRQADSPMTAAKMGREHFRPLRPDWETVIKAVVDFALAIPEVDPQKIVLSGWSLGGYLAPRAASGEPRLAACVADPGQWAVLDSIRATAIRMVRTGRPSAVSTALTPVRSRSS